MQTLTDAQRDILLGSPLHIEAAGAEVLRPDLTLNTDYGVAGDVSGDLASASVQRNMLNTIHGTAHVGIARELRWGIDLLRLYMDVSNGGPAERFYCGVYSLTTPGTPLGSTPITYDAQGLDRVYLLDRDVGDDYSVASGTTYYDALVQVFADAGLTGVFIDSAADDLTLPADKDWPFVGRSSDPDQTSSPVTWLRVVNDLQQAWNGQGVWADGDGILRCQRYQPPSERPPEFTFTFDDPLLSIVAPERSVVADFWKMPNRWIFVWKNRPGGESNTEGDGRYTVDLPDGDERSAASRGLVWAKRIDYDAASQDALEALGDRRVAEDTRLSSVLKVKTGPFPVAGHYDVFAYVDAAAGGSRKVVATSWEFDLFGGDVSWTWETV